MLIGRFVAGGSTKWVQVQELQPPLGVRLHDWPADTLMLQFRDDRPTHIRSRAEPHGSLNIEALHCFSQTHFSCSDAVVEQTAYDRANFSFLILNILRKMLLSCFSIPKFPHNHSEAPQAHVFLPLPTTYGPRAPSRSMPDFLRFVEKDGDRPDLKLLLIPLCIT